MLLSLLWVFLVTFVVFASAFIQAGFNFTDNGDKTEAGQWNLTTINLVFNILDTVGRTLGGKVILKRRTVVALSLLRTIFIFTTLATAVQASPAWLFQSDWFRLLNLALFALSNGYVSTLCTVLAPQMVSKDQQQQVGLFNSIFLCLGITLGSIVQIPVGLIYEK